MAERAMPVKSPSLFIALLILAIGISLAYPAAILASEYPQKEPHQDWVVLETGYLTIYYVPGADLNRVESSLRKRASYFSSDMPGDDAGVEERIRYQLDALFRRAEDVLDMHPGNMHVSIKIFRTRKELNDEYAKIFNADGAGSVRESNFQSFYINKYNTIYTSEEDISDSVIAHEMGHAIVDHYFAVIPPERIRELLASYVDLHLAE